MALWSDLVRPLNTTGEVFQRWGLFVRNRSRIRSHLVGFLIVGTKLSWLIKSRILSLLMSPGMTSFASGSVDKMISQHSVRLFRRSLSL